MQQAFGTAQGRTCAGSLTARSCRLAAHHHPFGGPERRGLRQPLCPQLRAAAAEPVLPVVLIPQSQEDAVTTAAQCVSHLLRPQLDSIKATPAKKGFARGAGAGARLHWYGVEIPVADDSARATAELAALLQDTVTQQLRQAGATQVTPAVWTVVHAKDGALQQAKAKGGRNVQGLRQACQQKQLGGLLLLVEPTVSDVALVEQLFDEVWDGPAAVILNPEWAQQPVPADYKAIVDSVTVAYSFLPCAISGLLGPKEGAVLRAVEKGLTPNATPWKILLKTKEQFVQVGAMPRRPTQDDLQLAFINASAATSPLAKTARFFKGFGQKTKK